MAIAFSCQCGKPLRAQAEAVGKRTKCPHCGAVLTIPGGPPRAAAAPEPALATAAASSASPAKPPAPSNHAGAAVLDELTLDLDWDAIEAPMAPESTTASSDHLRSGSGVIPVSGLTIPDVPRHHDGSRQYRVLGQKEQGMVGKFNPAKLEETLNAYSHLGWTLKSAVSLNLPGHTGNHDEIVVILER